MYEGGERSVGVCRRREVSGCMKDKGWVTGCRQGKHVSKWVYEVGGGG